MTMTYYLHFSGSAFVGRGLSADGTIPSDAIECTHSQFDDWGSYILDTSTTPNTVASAPTSVLVANAQSAKISALYGALMDSANTSYLSAIYQPVSFTTAAGVTKTYQADTTAITNIQRMLNAYSGSGGVPSGFYWVADDNTQVAFTLADLEGLAKAIGDQGWSAFENYQTKKADVNSATTVSDVDAVAW